MTGRPTFRGRASERGEGNLRLIAFLLFVALLGYLGVKNVPTYFAMQNLKHDLAEMARGSGVVSLSADRMQRQASEIVQEYAAYGVTINNVDILKDGKLTTVRLHTTQPIDLIVTTYNWDISEEYKQTAY